ncbi:MAG: acyltransferase [Succinatimonas hippei]|nr:acyltransferase [Succinatimonas hippei]
MNEKRLDIDFLKSIAIFSVILYHLFDLLKSNHLSSVHLFDGGFLGVDVFLLISGFLICGSIVSKLNTDSFSLIQFYTRRVTRIYQPLLVFCALVLLIGYFILFPITYNETGREVANVIIGITNFRFANTTGYFDLESIDKVLLHTWYIAITIQFYLICPIIFIALRKIFKSHFNLSVLLFTILLIITAFLCNKPGKGYLLTQCRIYEMFLGACIYLYKDNLLDFTKKIKLSQSLLHYIGIVLLIVSIFTVRINNNIWQVYTSFFTLGATALVIISNYNNSLFRNKFFTVPGQMSYSLYLWHWPILVVAVKFGLDQSFTQLLITTAVITVFSVLSYLFVEKKKYHYSVLLVLIALCAIPFFYIKTNSYLSKYTLDEDVSEVGADYKLEEFLKINDKFVYRIPRNSEEINTFIIGDSHSGHYHKFFYYEYEKPVYYTTIGGIMAYGPEFEKIEGERGQTFFKIYEKMLDVLNDGSRVILSNNWYYQYDANYLSFYNLKDSKESLNKFLKALYADFDSQIEKHPNLKFYIIGQNIYSAPVVKSCVFVDLSKTFLKNFIDQSKCYTFKDFLETTVDEINEGLRSYADSRDNVYFIDRNKAIVADEKAKTYFAVSSDKKPIYIDKNHYTQTGASIVGHYIMKQIDGNE